MFSLLFPLLLGVASADASYGIVCADIACASCEPAPIASATSDSVLPGYGPELAFDGDLSTAWCEGTSGTGVGRSVDIVLSEPRAIEAILVHGGYFKSASILSANGRIRELSMVAGNAEGPQHRASLVFQDPSVVPLRDPCLPPGEAGAALSGADWFARTCAASGALAWHNDDNQSITRISLTIADVYPGARYEDTCISEIQILTRDP
ncbi:MAG: hypothetical protein ACI8S6_000928 [Myxococcota bacterium]|jgi:hypothetical protein